MGSTGQSPTLFITLTNIGIIYKKNILRVGADCRARAAPENIAYRRI